MHEIGWIKGGETDELESQSIDDSDARHNSSYRNGEYGSTLPSDTTGLVLRNGVVVLVCGLPTGLYKLGEKEHNRTESRIHRNTILDFSLFHLG